VSSSRHLLAEHSLSVSGQNTDYETVPIDLGTVPTLLCLAMSWVVSVSGWAVVSRWHRGT
ncbi:hypothetical protein R3Q16_33080, partial [Rhodococcus globerulus]|nr:hypothetical protein [Rhodococcus globerulus]